MKKSILIILLYPLIKVVRHSVQKCIANIKVIVQMHQRIYDLNLALFKMY